MALHAVIVALAGNINQLFAQLSDIEEERKRLDKIQQNFVSNVSHELRTPITVIKGSLEVLDEGLIEDPNEMHEYFSQMLSDTVHLERLVNDLLELSRLQNSNFEIIKSKLNLTDILTESVRSMQRIAEKKQVEILLENTAGLVLFCGDYNRLRQMFMIILDNAVKFSPPQSTVSVKMYRQKTGCGISMKISPISSTVFTENVPTRTPLAVAWAFPSPSRSPTAIRSPSPAPAISATGLPSRSGWHRKRGRRSDWILQSPSARRRAFYFPERYSMGASRPQAGARNDRHASRAYRSITQLCSFMSRVSLSS